MIIGREGRGKGGEGRDVIRGKDRGGWEGGLGGRRSGLVLGLSPLSGRFCLS